MKVTIYSMRTRLGIRARSTLKTKPFAPQQTTSHLPMFRSHSNANFKQFQTSAVHSTSLAVAEKGPERETLHLLESQFNGRDSSSVALTPAYLFGKLKSRKLTQSFASIVSRQLRYLRATDTAAAVRESSQETKKSAAKARLSSFQRKKDQFYRNLHAVNLSNGVSPMDELKRYRFYLGQGNNSELVLRVMRTRWWWQVTRSVTDAHFVWTSGRHKRVLAKLPLAPGAPLPSEPTSVRVTSGFHLLTKSQLYTPRTLRPVSRREMQVCNRFIKTTQLSNKKRLFYNLKKYYADDSARLFQVVPYTLHITHGLDDPLLPEFFQKLDTGLWILKPGELTNQGQGISICSTKAEVEAVLQTATFKRTFIIQKYIQNPLLINGRKFDIRCFALVTCINGVVQGYFYNDGYIRTASHEFTLTTLQDRFVHLTNDAVQNQSPLYGKYEPGNKLSFAELQAYLAANYPAVDWEQQVVGEIRRIIADTLAATAVRLDPGRRMHCFELFGFDFMLDDEQKVWLIEANTNPCLSQQCYYLSSLLPTLLDNTFRLVLDPLLPPPQESNQWHAWVPSSTLDNKFELVFVDG